MTLALRLALRDLRGALASFRLFLAALAVGVAAIAAVGNVTAAIEAGLARDGATLLGGDAEITLTYRFARPDERAFMDATAARVSEVVAFRSLAVAGGDAAVRALTEVRGVDDAYPLLGEVVLDPPMPLAQALAGRDGTPGAVMEPVLASRLGLTPGDRFRLGARDYVLAARLTGWPDDGDGGFGFGPRLILRTADLAGSGLIAEGTLFSTLYRLRLPLGTDAATVHAELDRRFPDSGLRWRDAGEGLPGTEQVVDRVGAFLMLLGLAGLAVGGVGVGAAVRAWLARRVTTIAVMRTLGATGPVIAAAHLFQIALVTLAGIALGLALGTLPLLLAAPAIAALLPLPAVFGLYPVPLAQATSYGLLVAALFTLWPLARVERIRPAVLIRDSGGAGGWPRWPWLLAIAAVLALLVLAAVRFTGTARLTLAVFAGIAVTLGLLALAGHATRLVARASRGLARGRPALRLALASVAARGGATVATVLALGLGLGTLSAVGQIEGNLRASLLAGLPRAAPSFFVLDIQPDQIDAFRARLAGDPAVRSLEAAPMLRGIISAVNGVPAADIPGAPWVLRGDRGVTYAATPPEGTVLTAGAWWPEDYTGPPQMSFSAAEAETLGLHPGDTVTVNILGREITATVTSLRRVEFQSLGMGFVIVLDPAALAGAPHSWIATLTADRAAEARLFDNLTAAFPNITVISTRAAAARVAEVVGKAALAIRVAAGVTLGAGFLVLIGVAGTGEAERRRETAIARSLGASRRVMLSSLVLRMALIGLAAGVVALAAGFLGGWAVSRLAMDIAFHPVWPQAVAVVAGGIAVATLAGIGLALGPLNARPASLLRARE
ncbi:MAG: drug:proton antiporter [Rubellimicrobium sp.]|nr:drug:proton antiporter [Rubellimicrobium sp.]